MKKMIIALLTMVLLLSACSSNKQAFNKENLNLRTTFEETIGTTEIPVMGDDQKLWIVALPAIIMSSNRSNLDTLEVDRITNDSAEKWRNILSRDWGINNREDLLETI